jgi:multidrug efflux pump
MSLERHPALLAMHTLIEDGLALAYVTSWASAPDRTRTIRGTSPIFPRPLYSPSPIFPLVIYLVLAAQFESWRDPFVILMSVPLSIAGAMAFLFLGFATVNIYTQVGLITLIGLIAKNGILIVEFANQLREREGLDKRDAVVKASMIRLRPILMTTVSMLVAMIPLLTASGPGAVSRFDIGLVITTGLGIGTLFTLFIVPGMYVLVASKQTQQQTEAAAAARA